MVTQIGEIMYNVGPPSYKLVYNPHYSNYSWLVVLTILKNMKVNGKDHIPYEMENQIHVPNHQADSYIYHKP